jgi:hypothetical protein
MKVSRSKDNGSKWASKASKAFRGLKIGGSSDETKRPSNSDSNTRQDLPWGGMGPRTKAMEDNDDGITEELTKTIIMPKRSKGGDQVIEVQVSSDANMEADKKNSKRLDEYGFIVNLDDKGALRDSDSVDIPGGAYTPSPDTPKRSWNHQKQKRVKPRERRQLARLHQRREKKWIDMLQNWDSTVSTKPKMRKLRQRIRKGIPNSMRGEVWARISNAKEKVANTEKGVYDKLVALSCPEVNESNLDAGLENFEPNQEVNVDDSNLRDTIERDLTRTFPRHNMFYDAASDSSDDEYSDGSYDRLSSYTSNEGSVSDEHDIGDNAEDSTHGDSDSKASVEAEADTDPYIDNEEEAAEVPEESNSSFCGQPGEENCLSKVTANCPPSIFQEKKEPAFEPLVKQKKKHKRVVDLVHAEGGQAKLRRVLRAYSVYDSEVGYCQGMNFIAGMFITFVDEEEAFWLLVSVMCHSPCRMRGLFSEGMTEAHQVLHVADRLIQQFYPKLARHFERQQIHITMFATQWLLTMYTSSYPFDVVTRVWDAFLSEGWKVAYRVMLALLERSQSLLMKMHFEEILNYFKEMPFEIDSNEILEMAFKIPLKKKHITKYAKEWERQQKRATDSRR